MIATGKSSYEIIKEKDLVQVSDTVELSLFVARVIADNQGPVEDYRNGKEKAIGFLVGPSHEINAGQSQPGGWNKLLKEKLK